MKEISGKLANELMALIADAERQSDRAYAAAKIGDSVTAERWALTASVRLFEAKTHLEWHMSGHLDSEQQAAPEAAND